MVQRMHGADLSRHHQACRKQHKQCESLFLRRHSCQGQMHRLDLLRTGTLWSEGCMQRTSHAHTPRPADQPNTPTSCSTLGFWLFSTLLIAWYCMVFFFRPLYTVECLPLPIFSYMLHGYMMDASSMAQVGVHDRVIMTKQTVGTARLQAGPVMQPPCHKALTGTGSLLLAAVQSLAADQVNPPCLLLFACLV